LLVYKTARVWHTQWLYGARGVNLVGNLGGGRWQTIFGSKFLTRKTGRVETSDTVEDRIKMFIITGQLKLKHICAIFGGTWRITVPPFDIWGTCPPCPRGIYAPAMGPRTSANK